MRTHSIAGGGGLKLHVNDDGPLDAPALLFIHGWAQHAICWRAQSPLAERFRCVALDLRGHGRSEAPQRVEAYTETKLWGDDIQAIITELDLRDVILVGWSYGARVIGAYLATHGSQALAGLVPVGGIIAIGEAREPWMVGEGSPGRNPDLYTNDQEKLLSATANFVEDCTYRPLDRALYGTLVGANMLVTPLVRRALFKGTFDCRAHYEQFSKPALVLHGTQDTVVAPEVAHASAEALPNAKLSLWDETGHAPFIEHAQRFNAELSAFADAAIKVAA